MIVIQKHILLAATHLRCLNFVAKTHYVEITIKEELKYASLHVLVGHLDEKHMLIASIKVGEVYMN